MVTFIFTAHKRGGNVFTRVCPFMGVGGRGMVPGSRRSRWVAVGYLGGGGYGIQGLGYLGVG